MGTYRLNWNSPKFYTEYVEGGAFPDVEVLYKYRDWKCPYHRRILEDPSIFLASPSSFEDPLDCHVPEDFPTKEELYSLFWKLSFRELSKTTRSQERIKWVKNCCLYSPLADENERKRQARDNYKNFCDKFGVLSLTADSHSEEMWDKYGAAHTGFCVGYHKATIEKYLGGIGPVIYTNVLPHVVHFKDSLMTQHIKNVFFKEMKWNFEQEFRGHKLWPSGPSLEDRNIKIPVSAICEIVVGRNIDQRDYKEIKIIADTKYPHAVFRME